MAETLPAFRYHPDPVATKAIQPSPVECVCCGKSRGFIYVGPVYATSDLDELLCPWCIADGSAAAKLGASFADSLSLTNAGVPPPIVEEVNQRTPAYSCWQEPEWLAHCGDACEFRGDATHQDVASASEATKTQWLALYQQDEEGWAAATSDYEPGGDSALYKFVCRHCGLVLLGWDLS